MIGPMQVLVRFNRTAAPYGHITRATNLGWQYA